MKIFYNKFYNKKFPGFGWVRTTHQHFTNCCCPYIQVYVVASNTKKISFSPAISSAHGVISSINAHHTRLVKLFSFNLVCPKIFLCKSIFDKILLDEKKGNTVCMMNRMYKVSPFSNPITLFTGAPLGSISGHLILCTLL